MHFDDAQRCRELSDPSHPHKDIQASRCRAKVCGRFVSGPQEEARTGGQFLWSLIRLWSWQMVVEVLVERTDRNKNSIPWQYLEAFLGASPNAATDLPSRGD